MYLRKRFTLRADKR
jgi:uncharacterized surface protein with fasciclin (FAS1) repeats